MPISIQTNIASLFAQNNLSKAQGSLQASFDRLSSGLRINSAKDDAAGLAISESMRLQIRSYTVVERNANDAISMAQTADGALGQMSDMIGRMRELAAEAANGSLQTSDRAYIQTEFAQLQREMTRIMTSTKFNGVQLVNSLSAAVAFQVGINNTAADRITATFGGLKLTALITASTQVGGTAGNAQVAMDLIDAGLKTISTTRARYGALMNRLDTTISNLETMRLNVSAAESRIRDVDVAMETSALSREQVLAQGGAAVLAQANQMPQLALKLLQG